MREEGQGRKEGSLDARKSYGGDTSTNKISGGHGPALQFAADPFDELRARSAAAATINESARRRGFQRCVRLGPKLVSEITDLSTVSVRPDVDFILPERVSISKCYIKLMSTVGDRRYRIATTQGNR